MPLRPPPIYDPEDPCPETRADFALLDTGPDAIGRYWKLAIETSQHIWTLENEGQRSCCSRWFYQDEARWAVRALEEPSSLGDSAELIKRWKEWADEFEAIAARSPKWRLKGMISLISETHIRLSWPHRWERQIWDWAMGDETVSGCPFDDRDQIIDENFRLQLRQAATEAGGFLYRCEESHQIRFAPIAALDRVWRHQDHLAAIDRDKPFGFFHDVGRPDFNMRPLTSEEEETSSAMRRRPHQGRRRSRVLSVFGWLAR